MKSPHFLIKGHSIIHQPTNNVKTVFIREELMTHHLRWTFISIYKFDPLPMLDFQIKSQNSCILIKDIKLFIPFVLNRRILISDITVMIHLVVDEYKGDEVVVNPLLN